MKPIMKSSAILKTGHLLAIAVAVVSLAATAHAAAPGITGGATSSPSFNLTAQSAFLNQPDGSAVYSWGYGCSSQPAGFAPSTIKAPAGGCPNMQVPGPTLVVHEGDTVTINLTNGLPTSAGNTSITFPGMNVMTNCPPSATVGAAQQGLLTCEAVPGGSVTYTIVASTPGTHAYYSGTQGDLQIEMGLYGAIIVLPTVVPAVAGCHGLGALPPHYIAPGNAAEVDFRLAASAYDHPRTCYDREYLFQFAEMDGNIHARALAQVSDPARIKACATGAGTPGCGLDVPTEPYHPSYFLINGRSMPDDMDSNYGPEYPHQPYNGNPHLHPGEQVLLRVIGQGHWQHPFHEHGNHVRILARDGNLILSQSSVTDLAGAPLFTTDTTPGQAFDGIFYFTGRGLNWDMYGHNPSSTDPLAKLTCTPDANGYNTGNTQALNYYEWCQDHNKPLEAAPFGDVATGGPATLPNPNIFTNGAWYGGSPYLGPDAALRGDTTLRSTGTYPGSGSPGCVTSGNPAAPGSGGTSTPNCTNLQPANVQANPANERGWAFMWHSHNEREITTNNVFPGGMLMMMLVDSREFVIDETN